MIFIAAQHVHSSRGESGINVYYYRRDTPAPRDRNRRIDIFAAQQDPGELVRLDSVIKPGGNRIPAYLDFVCETASETDDVRHFFEHSSDELRVSRPPLLFRERDFALVFNLDIGLYTRRQEEFGALSASVLNRLMHPPTHSLRDLGPLEIEVRHEPSGRLVLALRSESEARLRQKKGESWVTHPVGIDVAVLADFETLVGSSVRQFGAVVTGLSEDELLSLGGVRYVDETRRVLAEWPSRQKR